MHSALYHGTVEHTRARPVRHTFRYSLQMCYIDLAEVALLRRSLRLFGRGKWHPLAFVEADHRMETGDSLADEIRNVVASNTGLQVSGPIRLLSLLRTWGHYFSPLNLYYCFDQCDKTVQVVVAEVSNTPWLERHRYVLYPLAQKANLEFEFQHEKDFHVSPFMAMEQHYRWQCTPPGDRLRVQVATQQEGTAIFAAEMKLQRRPLTDANLARSLCRYPLMTAQIVSAIYWQALRLWWKKCPLHTHPNKLTSPADTVQRVGQNIPNFATPRRGYRPH